MFVAYEVSIELNRQLRPIVNAIKRNDLELADQMHRAAMSITLNLSEGARCTGGIRRKRYETAHGSASEVKGSLDLAEVYGWIEDTSEVRKILDRQLALLWGLTHSKNLQRIT